MKNRTKIALASILVGFVAIATGLSTLAWFNGSSSLIISDFKISLVDQKLLVSTDNEHFYDNLYMATEDVVESEENGNVGQFLPDVGPFRSISSMFQDDWFKPDVSDDQKALSPVFKRNIPSTAKLTKSQYVSASDYGNATDGYLSQELYFKAQISGVVTIDSQKTAVIPDEEENLVTARKIVDANYNHQAYDHLESYDEKVDFVKLELDKVAKSARFSILVLNNTDYMENAYSDYAYTIIDPTKEEGETTYLGGILDNNLDGYYDYYDSQEVIYGEVSGNAQYGSNVGTSIEKPTFSCFDAAHKDGVAQLDSESMKADNQIAIEDSKSLKEAEDEIKIHLSASSLPDENGRLITSTKKIVLSFYLEGWDKDNTTLSMYAHFKVNLSFKFASSADRS